MSKTIENSLFEWDDWDGDWLCMQFYNCILIKKLGQHEVGTRVPVISMLYEKSLMQLWDEKNKMVSEFNLSLNATPRDYLKEAQE